MKLWHYKNIMECSKSAEFPKFIKDLAFEMGLALEIDVDESGWIFKHQTIRFKVTDNSQEKVERFRQQVLASVEQYEEQLSSIY